MDNRPETTDIVFPQDYLQIHTSEQIILHRQIAGVGTRAYAYIADLVIRTGIMAFYWLSLWGMSQFIPGLKVYLTNIWHISFVALAFFAYHPLTEILGRGQSPGKRWTKIRITKTDGAHLTTIDTVVRNVFRLVDFLPVSYVIGFFLMVFSSRSQRLGDMAVNSLAVRDDFNAKNFRIELEKLESRMNQNSSSVSIPGISEADHKLVISIYQNLGNQDEFLANQLATRAVEKLKSKYPEFQNIEMEPMRLLGEIVKKPIR